MTHNVATKVTEFM